MQSLSLMGDTYTEPLLIGIFHYIFEVGKCLDNFFNV